MSKAPTARLKKVLPSSVTHLRTAYLQNSCVSETARLFSDILEVTDSLSFKGYLVSNVKIQILYKTKVL